MSRYHEATVRDFARFVASNLGLHFPDERLPELAEKMAVLAARSGDDLEGYLVRLMSAPLSPEHMKVLAAALTIGETYFLRDPKSYRAFGDVLLPGLIAARRGTEKTLKIWSAGCSSGEEPYTIAILLSRALPDLADWKVTLLATDINHQALERGRRGIYSKWSFRNAPAWLMDYFTCEPDGRYRIVPRIRNMVRFVHLNLADAEDRAPCITRGMDFIFCRNVMLYFHAELIRRTLARFHTCLKDGGWLFAGPTEVDHHAAPGFACRHFDGALALRKEGPGSPCRDDPKREQTRLVLPARAQAAPSTPKQHAQVSRGDAGPANIDTSCVSYPPPPPAGSEAGRAPVVPGTLQQAREHYREGRYQQAAELALEAREPGEEREALQLAARSFANIGRLAEARECCEKAIARDRLRAESHYLLSIIQEQQDDAEGAVSSLRRALYIDHDYLLAYFALGNLHRKRGETKEARQSFANALRLLKRRDPQEVLPDTGGLTAAKLSQLIEAIGV